MLLVGSNYLQSCTELLVICETAVLKAVVPCQNKIILKTFRIARNHI